MTIKDLKKQKAVLGKVLKLDAIVVDAFIELFEKKKIAKPDILFKRSIPKINPATKYPFIYLELAKQEVFLMGFDFPVEKEVDEQLKSLDQRIAKAKKPKDKTLLELEKAFYTELKALNPKGFIKGLAKYAAEETAEDGSTINYLKAIPSSIDKKKLNKKELPNLVNELAYQTKTEVTVLFQEVGDQDEEETNDQETASTEASTDNEESSTTVEKVEDSNIELSPTQALSQAIKAATGSIETTVWLGLLAQAQELIAKEKTAELLELQKIIQAELIKNSGVDVDDPAAVKVQLEELVNSVEVAFFRFVNDDLKERPDFGQVQTAHQEFYQFVMATHTMMNTLAKEGNIDLQEAENFNAFKKPVSLHLQKASKAKALFKALAQSDDKIRELAQSGDRAKNQKRMEGILAQANKYTKKLMAFLNKQN